MSLWYHDWGLRDWRIEDTLCGEGCWDMARYSFLEDHNWRSLGYTWFSGSGIAFILLDAP